MILECLWDQLGASIDMLENAIALCPKEHWDTEKRFWYNAYHCLFFLDYYLTLETSQFHPPKPFSLSEFEMDMPDRVYTQQELLGYLQYCRKKGHGLLAGFEEAQLKNPWTNVSGTMNYTVFEILLYNMRHVQHHTGQLNLILRQDIHHAPQWIRKASIPLAGIS